MLLFGVTGGIASGKSEVCKLLREHGIPILQADPVAQQLTNSLPEIRAALVQQFGPDVYTAAGELNKDKMRQLVFSGAQNREKVNQIIHPHVLQWIRTEARRLQDKKQAELVGVEAALIFESGMQEMLDRVVVVDAPAERRASWLQKRDDLTDKEVEQRMAAQMSVDEKRRRADYVLENNGSLAELRKKVNKLLTWLYEQSKSHEKTPRR